SFLKLEGRPLISLIGKLNDIEGLERIRLSSLEPRIITESWAKQLATFEKVCPHFHLSMQSGCDETLKRMNRHYTSAEYAEKVDILRKIYENPAITTDVIVGFPGETEEEFETTFEFVKKIGFADLHIFQYSKRDGTIAAKMDDQVSAELKKQRSEQLAKVMEQSKKEYEKLFEGIDQEILFETKQLINGKTYLTGFNTRYVRFFLDTEKAGEYGALSGEICCIRAADLRTE
ncbi:MAG: radical SAM protein, partial [Eubacterium sp.]|nr:radical SAM protein [Eubacterium sp.]